jgi:DegV family protein with EDD domain
MLHILTDSTADLAREQVDRYQIGIVPLSVYLDGRDYQDGVDLSPKEIFMAVERGSVFPKTAAPSVADYCAAVGDADEALYIGLSSALSAAVQNARLASESCVGRLRVVDSLNLSAGIGLLVLMAAELRDQGLSADEIEQRVHAAVPLVRTAFMIDTLQYLYLGGRCTAIQSVMGSLLKLRPVIAVNQDGTLGVREKVRGARKRALEALLRDYAEHLTAVDRHRVFVTHAGCAEDAAYLAAELQRMAPIEDLQITEAGCVISSHCGPGCIGILYLLA